MRFSRRIGWSGALVPVVVAVLLATAAPAQAATVVAVWNMDGSGSTMVDSSGRGHNGKLRNVVPLGTAYEFRGKPSYVTVPSHADFAPGTRELQDLAVRALLRGPDRGGGRLRPAPQGALGHRGRALQGRDPPPGRAFCQFRGSAGMVTISNGPNLANNQWHRITCTRTGNTVVLTVDGAVVVEDRRHRVDLELQRRLARGQEHHRWGPVPGADGLGHRHQGLGARREPGGRGGLSYPRGHWTSCPPSTGSPSPPGRGSPARSCSPRRHRRVPGTRSAAASTPWWSRPPARARPWPRSCGRSTAWPPLPPVDEKTPLPGPLRLPAQGPGGRRRAQSARSAGRDRAGGGATRSAAAGDPRRHPLRRHPGRRAARLHPAAHRHPDHHARVAVPAPDQRGARGAARGRDGDRRRGARGGGHQARRPPGGVPRPPRRAARTPGPADRPVGHRAARSRRSPRSWPAAARCRSSRRRRRRSGTCRSSSRSRT